MALSIVTALLSAVVLAATTRTGTTPTTAITEPDRRGPAPAPRQVQPGGVGESTGTVPSRGDGSSVPGPPSLGVVSQDGWIGPRGTFRAQVRAVTPAGGYTLDARLYRAVPNAETVLAGGSDSPPARSLGLLTEAELPVGTTTRRIEVPVVPEADGSYRIVISAQDPGVANWLDTGGYNEGLIQGRWNLCDGKPLPALKLVKLADLRRTLPTETGSVTPAEREKALRDRQIGRAHV